MSDQYDPRLATKQLAALETALHHGSAEASKAVGKWIGKPSVVEIASLKQLLLEETTSVLATGDEPVCFCSAEINGPTSGSCSAGPSVKSRYRWAIFSANSS